jgi:hypothetical protein
MSQNIRKATKKQKFDNIFDLFCLKHKPSYSNFFLPTRKQQNTNTVENKSNNFNTTICFKTLKSLQSFLMSINNLNEKSKQNIKYNKKNSATFSTHITYIAASVQQWHKKIWLCS